MLQATVNIPSLLQFGGMLRDAEHAYHVEKLEPTIVQKRTRVYIGIYFDLRIGGLIAMCHLTLLKTELGLSSACEKRINFHISLDYWICRAVRPPPPPAVLAAPVEPALPPPDVLVAPDEPTWSSRGNSASRCFICGDPLPRPPSQDGRSVRWWSPSRCSLRDCSPRRWWLEGPASEDSDSDLDEPPPPYVVAKDLDFYIFEV